MNAPTYFENITIADATALSAPIDLGAGLTPVAIIVPSTWTTAVISFAASPTLGGTYVPLYRTDGTEVTTGSIAGGTDKWIALFPADLSSVQFFKIRSGTVAAPVTQSGGDTLTLVCRGLS
jgi:hypothetical protein